MDAQAIGHPRPDRARAVRRRRPRRPARGVGRRRGPRVRRPVPAPVRAHPASADGRELGCATGRWRSSASAPATCSPPAVRSAAERRSRALRPSGGRGAGCVLGRVVRGRRRPSPRWPAGSPPGPAASTPSRARSPSACSAFSALIGVLPVGRLSAHRMVAAPAFAGGRRVRRGLGPRAGTAAHVVGRDRAGGRGRRGGGPGPRRAGRRGAAGLDLRGRDALPGHRGWGAAGCPAEVVWGALLLLATLAARFVPASRSTSRTSTSSTSSGSRSRRGRRGSGPTEARPHGGAARRGRPTSRRAAPGS